MLREGGAHDWNRTSDLFLTKEVLYRLSYMSTRFDFGDTPGSGWLPGNRAALIGSLEAKTPANSLERETGIEPAPSAWKAEVLPLNYSRLRAAS